MIEGDGEEQIAAFAEIFAKSFNYRGCYEHVFSSLGFSDTPSRLPELMNGAQALANKSTRSSSMMPTAHRQSSSAQSCLEIKRQTRRADDRRLRRVMADTIRQHGADGLVLLPNTVAANYWRRNWVIALTRRCLRCQHRQRTGR